MQWQGDIFTEKKMGFGLVLGWLQILEFSTWAVKNATLISWALVCFHGQKFVFNFQKNIAAFALEG